MATVRDLAGSPRGGGIKVDVPRTKPNRRVTSTPVASLTPAFVGEIVEWYDSVTALTYQFRATSTTNTSWVREDFRVNTAA